MDHKNLDKLIGQLESHLECWKQFNYFLSHARDKNFSEEDETQFLEVKSILAQELELILGQIDAESLSKEEIHTMLSRAPSLRFASEMSDGELRGLENTWHKIFINWQSILGQLKVARQKQEKKGFFGRLFGG
jgi:hypothetical protein